MPEIAIDEFGQRFIIPDDGGDPIPTPATTVEEAQQIEFISSLKSMGRTVRETFGADRDELRLEEQAENELLAGVRQERPIATGVGGALPFGLTTGGIGGGVATSGALGALEGFLDFDATSTDQGGSAGSGTISAVLGDLAGRAAGRVANGIMAIGRSFRTAPAAEALEAVGGRATAGQRIDDPTLRALETSLSSDALTNRVFEEIGQQNLTVGNEAAAKAIGYAGDIPDVIDEGVLDVAATRLEGVFNDAGETAGVLEMGAEFGEKVLGLEQFRKLRKLGKLPDLEAGTLSGPEIGTVRQALSEEMGQAFDKGQGQLGLAIREVIDSLDESLKLNIGDEAAAALDTAREQWNVLRTLEGTNVVSGGNVNPVTFNKRLRSTFGTSATRGRTNQLTNPETGQLLETMKALSDPKVRPIVPSSGTAERQAVREAISNPAGAAVRGLASPVIGAFENTPAAAGIVGAILSEQAPLIFRQGGRQAGIGGDDALNELIFGTNQ